MEEITYGTLERLARNAITDCFFPIRWSMENECRLKRCIEKAGGMVHSPRDLNLFENEVVRLFEEDYNNQHAALENPR